MSMFYLLGVDSGASWAGPVDTALLALIASPLIYIWVIRPLKQATQQNELFNTLVNSLDAGVIITGMDNRIRYVNPSFTRITGYSAAEVMGQSPSLLHGDDVIQPVVEQTRQAIAEGKPVRVLQLNRRKDGSAFWNDLQLNPIRSSSGELYQWVGLITDVSDQRRIEQQNLRWSSAIQQSDEAVCIFDQHGCIEFANEAYARNVGVAVEHLVGHDAWRFWEGDQTAYQDLRACMQGHASWSGRHHRVRADQSSYPALSSVTPVQNDDGSHAFVAVHRDITDMVTMEEELRQSQKMEAVGMLVGGIAHDFNNVLAGILGNLYLLRRGLGHDERMQQRIEAVEQQGYAAAGMVRQLLNFSRKDVPDVKVIDVVPFAKELIKFAHVSVPENISLDIVLEVKQLMLCCDSVQLQQSLLNLIVNATHALSGSETGGHIELLVSDQVPALVTHKHAAWACITVRDNGAGMDENIQQKMFEPFFTTKERGVGTGLGLAMVHSYVESLQGTIEVESGAGQGTSISLFFPAVPGELAHASEPQDVVRRGNGELVLLADDDHLVLEALTAILENANYRVLQASNGDEALRLCELSEEKFDLAILDVVMPGGTGVDVAKQLQQTQGNLPVVLMTGYDRQAVLAESHVQAHVLLRKPWVIAELNHALEQSLSGLQ